MCCPRSSSTVAEELIAALAPCLRKYAHKTFILYTSQAVLHNRSPCCALRWLHHMEPLYRAAPTVSCREFEMLCSSAYSGGGISCDLSICGMTLRTACEWGDRGLSWPHLATFLLPGVSRSSANICVPSSKAAVSFKPLHQSSSLRSWMMGPSNQDAAEKAAPALVVIHTNPFASPWKCNLPLSFCSVWKWPCSSSLNAPLINRRRMMSDVTMMHRNALQKEVAHSADR